MKLNKVLFSRKVIVAAGLGIFCALFAFVLRKSTEFAEENLFDVLANVGAGIFLVIVPALGLCLIYFLNRNVFRSPANKGIAEVFEIIDRPNQSLPRSKMFSHFFGGLITVATGGSTGIEVPTIIASSTAGALSANWLNQDQTLKKHLLIAGAAAGMAALFNSPLGGLFFGLEVLADYITLELLGLLGVSIISASLVSWKLDDGVLFSINTDGWKVRATPYFMCFACATAVVSVYLTKLVINAKAFFTRHFDGFKRAVAGGLIVGICIFLIVPLYGEGYHVMQGMMSGNVSEIFLGMEGGLPPLPVVLGLGLILFIKPIATSVTLAAGGDGGVFAPSLFLGAVVGLLYSHCLNTWFSTDLIESNFMIVGMAALLSSSIQAPLTAIFLTASITGSYELIIPLAFTSFLSMIISKKILPYTVYNYTKFR